MKNDGEKFGGILLELERAERKLVRAFNRWNKLRAKLARVSKRLDLAFVDRSEKETSENERPKS